MKYLGLFFLAGLLSVAPVSAADIDVRLVAAAREGDIAAVRTLLAQGVDVTLADGDGSTALHWAAARGDLAMTQALLTAGARVTAVTRLGAIRPLFMAARHGDAAVIDALLKAGASATETNGNGTTALMMAAGSGSVPAVTLLLARGADPNATDATNGQTALMFAAARNNTEVVRVLLLRGAEPRVTTKVVKLPKVLRSADGHLALSTADAVPDAVPEKPNVGLKSRVFGATIMGGMTALHFAAREGHQDAVAALVTGGAPVNLVSGGEKTAVITEAIINGHLDIAKFLLDHGADPTLANIDGLTPLYATIDMRWRFNSSYPQPTIEEEQTNYLALMNALLDKGADVNATLIRKLWFRKFRYGDDWVEPNGATALWRAAQANDEEAMRLLVGRGADPNVPTAFGVTPLMVAAGFGFDYQGTNIKPDARLAVVRYLVDDLHADVNAKDIKHYTPLHGAAFVGDNAVITYLVSKGANVKVRSNGRLDDLGDLFDVPEGTGDTVADMAAGPLTRARLYPETVKLVESLGSENSLFCRAAACVNATKAEKPVAGKPPGRD